MDAIAYIGAVKRCDPDLDKEAVCAAFVRHFKPERRRSVFVCDGYALRFSQARGKGFSNTVLSLSTLMAHDSTPWLSP